MAFWRHLNPIVLALVIFTSGVPALAADATAFIPQNVTAEGGSSGQLSLVGTRTTTGTWTISGLTVGKPLVIGINSKTLVSGVEKDFCFRVLSGSLIGSGPSNLGFSLGHAWISSGNSSVSSSSCTLVPTSTTVTLSVYSINPGLVAYAYQ